MYTPCPTWGDLPRNLSSCSLKSCMALLQDHIRLSDAEQCRIQFGSALPFAGGTPGLIQGFHRDAIRVKALYNPCLTPVNEQRSPPALADERRFRLGLASV